MSARSQTRVTDVWLAALLVAAPMALIASQPRPVVLPGGSALSWQALGPSRAGPITAITGDASQHGVFFVASEGAGLSTTTDFGASWTSILDGAPGGSVTAVAVGSTGSRLLAATRTASGSIVYRSDNSGTTWRAVSDEIAGPITHIAIDPVDVDLVFATVSDGSDAGEGGLYRSSDGGASFDRVLEPAEGWFPAIHLDSGRASTLIAVGRPSGTLAAGVPPLMFSVDAGRSWQPTRGVARPTRLPVAVDVTPAADDSLLMLITADTTAALYRSLDNGESWTPLTSELPSTDARTVPQLSETAGGDVLLAAGRLYRSLDSGQTFEALETPIDGAVTRLWTHPTMAEVWLAAGRLGTTVTVNGADTWSAPDNLPGTVAGRLAIDTAFPYRACITTAAAPACAPGRLVNGSARWQPLPAVLDDRVVPDPLDDNVVWGGAGVRYDRRTGQVTHAAPVAAFGAPRLPSVPLAFSANGRALHAGTDRVWRTTNGGTTWEAVSPALATSPARVSALAVSAIDARTLWAGLDDGRLFLTRGGAPWTEAARPAEVTGASIRAIEPSRFDPGSAYVVTTTSEGAVPVAGRLFRTRDEGATWVDIGAGINGTGGVFAVREDPYRRGLLFAGTDRSVFVSFDDGERWQPMALNLPPTPVTDLAIKDADLLAATGGRGVWMLEDFSPLRQMTADVLDADLFLFRPAQTWRVRASADATEPDGQAMLTYSLGVRAEDVTLEVIDTSTGDLIRRFSSATASPTGLGPDGTGLATDVGLHRVAWDLRYPPPVAGGSDVPAGTRVVPGTYQVRLMVDGRAARQTVTIRLDPRLRTSIIDLTAQRDLSRALDAARAAVDANSTVAGRDLGPLAGELNRLASALQQVDSRPSTSLEAAIENALTRVAIALGTDTR